MHTKSTHQECEIILIATPMFSKTGSTRPRHSLPCTRITSTKNPPSGLGPDLATCHFRTRALGWFDGSFNGMVVEEVNTVKIKKGKRISTIFSTVFACCSCEVTVTTRREQTRVKVWPWNLQKNNDLKDTQHWNTESKSFQPCNSTHAASGCRDHHPNHYPCTQHVFVGSWIINLRVYVS